jgi:anthranilate synthase component 1
MYYPSKQEFKKLAKKGNLIPVYKEISADIDTPVSSFLKIDDGKSYSYLLESVEGGEKIARYSFLGSNPSLIFKSKGRRIEITTRSQVTSHKSQVKTFQTKKDPLYEIKRLMSEYKFVPVKGLPRFCGGLVGYLGYDMVRFFESIPDKNSDTLKLPDSIFMLTDTILIFDHVDHKIKVVSNAHVRENRKQRTEDRNIDKVYDEAVKKIDGIISKLKAPPARVQGSGFRVQGKKLKINSNVTRKEFEAMVLKAKKYIRHGDIIQAVLSQRFEIDLGNTGPFDIYRRLRSINPSPYMYYLSFGELKVAGSSPEIMVRCEEGIVEVRPIAGTRPRGKDAKEDARLQKELLKDPKERAEHIMLVDLGRNDIGRVCDYHTVKTDELMVIEKYSHVMHIVSNVVGKLKKGKDIYDVVRATFPAGTVSGAPKIRAMEIIDELENTRRGPYAGCIGYFSFSGNLDTCITIRTLVIKGKKAYLQAGAGIVADSVPQKEFRETQNKARALIKAIELAGDS